ncbi:hypothetical protein HU200_010242 [Digitaria exilis]|uniref:Uncharacterized protein n=1 Tax=Digitaria exilis TaxID=1010633 RepID=A0A835KNI2_9POAL|nr:hypothetical protein HU200_010242 [Digitaria exilis]
MRPGSLKESRGVWASSLFAVVFFLPPVVDDAAANLRDHGRRRAMVAAMELEILGMNFGCVLAALSDAKIPDKDCLLPLISKLLGYAIVAASTTVKLPQVSPSFLLPVTYVPVSVSICGELAWWV